MSEPRTIQQIVQEYLPGEDEDFLDVVVWNLTGYPCFFHGDPMESFRQQLAEVAFRMETCTPLINDIGDRIW